MPFPVHPRPGHNSCSSFVQSRPDPDPAADPLQPCPRQNVLLATLSISLSLVLLLILALQFRPFSRSENESPFSEVQIKLNGGEEFSIFGRKLAMGKGGDFFLDIPYSSGTPRFQQAKLASLQPSFYAVHHGNGCPNGFTRTKPLPDLNWKPPPLETVPPSEQCQSLNIYRCIASPQLLPVLVYIHEGHWLKRSNANLDPSSTIHRLACSSDGQAAMLVVSLNYRMGPFGHFHMPGWSEERRNFALWDIQTALEWIQANIVHFGGHKAHVTVMARGEGARLLSLLGMLPQGKGLFKRQILISGSLFSPTFLQEDPLQEEGAFDPSMHFAIAANCANEREWQALLANGSEQMRAKVEECLAGIGPEAMVAAESRVRVPSFIRWPIIASSSAPATSSHSSFSVPDYSKLNIPQMPTIVGICTEMEERERRRERTRKKEGFRRRLEEALREELGVKLGQMGDLGRLKGDFRAEVIGHYLESVEGEEGQKMGEDEPQRLVDKIHADFLLHGPALLESFVRTRLANTRVYGFTFESAPLLNISILDSAEVAASQANPWASSQAACIDDLLFNPIPRRFDWIGEIVAHFSERVASFVIFGDPNPEDEEGRSKLTEWPTVFPRMEANGGMDGKEMGAEKVPNWMWMGGEEGERIEEEKEGGTASDDKHFWMYDMPRRIGIDPFGRLKND